MALQAARKAFKPSGAPKSGVGGLYFNILFGPPSMYSGALTDYQPTGELISQHSHGARIAAIARKLNIAGPVRCFVNACTGNTAIGAGLEALRSGEIEWAVVGGTEELSLPAYCAFHQLRALASQCRPFHPAREGLVMGEGSGVLLLEPLEAAKARGATIFAELFSCGSSNDAYDLVAPDPEGIGATGAMLQALKRAGITPDQIDYINAHGTGTPLNDIAEGKAIRRVFGPTESQPVTTSFKGNLGHCMGAASAIEAALTVEVLNQQQIPPTLGLNATDSNIELRLHPAGDEAIRVALSNSFGFGGANSVLVLGQPGSGAPLHTQKRVFIKEVGVALNGTLGSEESLNQLIARAPNSKQKIPFDPYALLGRKGLRHSDPTARLLAAITEEAFPSWPDAPPDRTGGILGVAQPAWDTANLILTKLKDKGVRLLNPGSVPHSTANSAMSWLLLRHHVTGYNATLSTGDCSGIDAILEGARVLSSDQADSMLAGGVCVHSSSLEQALQGTSLRDAPLADAGGLVHLSTNSENVLCEILGFESSFCFERPQKARTLAVERLLTAHGLSLHDIDLHIRTATSPTDPDPSSIDLGFSAGEVLGAKGSIGVAVGASMVTGSDKRALITCTSPEGFATAMLLGGILTPARKENFNHE